MKTAEDAEDAEDFGGFLPLETQHDPSLQKSQELRAKSSKTKISRFARNDRRTIFLLKCRVFSTN